MSAVLIDLRTGTGCQAAYRPIVSLWLIYYWKNLAMNPSGINRALADRTLISRYAGPDVLIYLEQTVVFGPKAY